MLAPQDVNLSDQRRSRHSAHPAQLMPITVYAIAGTGARALKNITVQSKAVAVRNDVFVDENTRRSETKLENDNDIKQKKF